MKRIPMLVSALVLPVAPISAQLPEPNPAQTVTAFFSAIERGDGRAAVALVAPEDVPDFRRRELAMVTYFFDQRDELRRMVQDPGPTAVAVGGLEASPRFDSTAVAKYATMPLPVYGVRTVAEFAALAPEELLARVLTESAQDDYPRKVIGYVVEHDSVAHVLFRRDDPTVRGENPWLVHVAQTMRRNGRWYVRLGYVFGGSRVMAVLFETLDEAPHE